MAKKKSPPKFGKLPRQFHFTLNPYPDMRFTKCPHCEGKTGQKKLPLLIHIEPEVLTALNYTNRYCRRCDRLIAHKDEIEHILTEQFSPVAPQLVGNPYLIFATLEKKAWRENIKQPLPFKEMLDHIADFKSYEDLRMAGGWCLKGTEPPVIQPPPSTEWVKQS